MAPAVLIAGASVAVALPALTAALLAPPSAPTAGCKDCRLESDYMVDSSWMQPDDLSKVHEAGREGGLSQDDADRMLQAIRDVGSHRNSFMVTVTDGGMLDMASNMIRSLDAVPCQAPRLIIGMGSKICEKFENRYKTTCVEVFQDTGSEDEVDWGSHAYWQVVFRKHVVLTMVAMSQVARHVVYTDPDIVFLDCPVAYLVKNYRTSHDLVFSPNNMLDPAASSVEDVAETYETRGMKDLVLGPHGRHADINTGLFLMASSSKVDDLMLKTMRIFKEQELVHGHYQQFSLVKALDNMPDLRIGVAPGDRLVNGNVFWGHRRLLKPAEVISVHANWMQSQLKVPCLKGAGLWVDGTTSARQAKDNWGSLPAATMDSRFATVESCGGDARAEPPRPTRPGCYLWLQSGCRDHKFNAQDGWRWMEDLKDRDECQVDSKVMYNKWCGVEDARTLFVAPATTKGPTEPEDPGCYVWMPGGCDSRSFHAQTAWRRIAASDFPDRESCAESAPTKFNKWCGAADAQALWVPVAPEVPSEPGCYAFLPTGCREHPSSGSDGWTRDTVAEESLGARTDQSSCEERKAQIQAWCGISNVRMAFVKG